MPTYRVLSGNPFNRIRFLLFLVTACVTVAASAQLNRYPILTQADSAEVWFDQFVNPANAAIINGPEYRLPFQGLRTHPFYQSSESYRSSVRYDNDLYKNVDLLYDTYADMLVLKSSTQNGIFLISLDRHLVQSFDLHGHHFKKYAEGMQAGIGTFFDVLFEKNNFAILVQRRKLERIDGTTSDYVEDDVHYLLNNGKWSRITGNSSFSKPLNKEQRKELAAFIKGNRMHVRKRNDEELKKLGAFYYSLLTRK